MEVTAIDARSVRVQFQPITTQPEDGYIATAQANFSGAELFTEIRNDSEALSNDIDTVSIEFRSLTPFNLTVGSPGIVFNMRLAAYDQSGIGPFNQFVVLLPGKQQ